MLEFLGVDSIWTAIKWTWYAVAALFVLLSLLWAFVPMAIYGVKRLLKKNISVQSDILQTQKDIKALLEQLVKQADRNVEKTDA